jgi:3-methylfumaryl-CoA hydratase
VSQPADHLDDWLGRSQTVHDVVTAWPLTALSATLESEAGTQTVPPLWHWLYFLPTAPLSEVGPDGHPQRGSFLPSVPLPRRMWAGGRLTFHAPLKVGERITRTSTITNIEDKTGRTGRLVFVTVRHCVHGEGELKVEEEQDIVYRDAPASSLPEKEPAKASAGEAFRRTVPTNPVLLFRYSALTFNGHRIHYDLPYATREEGYPGLVVHGPLIATLLAGLVRLERPDAALQSFAFRALRPAFANNPFTVCGNPSADGKTLDLWAKDHEDYLTMRATAVLA